MASALPGEKLQKDSSAPQGLPAFRRMLQDLLIAIRANPAPSLVALLVVVLYAPVFREASVLWFADDYSAHCVFIPFLTGLLVYWKRKEIASAPKTTVRAGGLLLAAGLLFEMLTWYGKLRSLALLSLLPVLLGLSLLLGGKRVTRILLFPILFLAFATPLPRTGVNAVSVTIQTLSMGGAMRLSTELGVPIEQDGFNFKLPNVTVEVARSCSGFKKLLSLSVMTCFYASLFAIPFWRQALLAAFALPIALLANIARITALVLSGYYWGAAGVHLFHDSSDLLVLALCFVLIVNLGKLLGCRKIRYAA